jgi:hypothetical protein
MINHTINDEAKRFLNSSLRKKTMLDKYSSFRTLTVAVFLGIVLVGARAEDAGQITLKGLVQDTSHNNLPGVAIGVKGGTEQTVSDDRGEFTIAVSADKRHPSTLVLSKKEYLTLKYIVKDPAKTATPRLTPVVDNNGLLAGTLDLSMTHAINPHLIKFLQTNNADKTAKTLDDGLYAEVVKRYGNRPEQQVRYRIRLPHNTKTIRGAFLISEHGVGGKMMQSKIFWDFADSNGFALIGFQGNPIQRGIYPASKLDEIIAQIGTKYEHPELAQVPVMTFGHSNGTGFSALYPALRPERTICWISYHSGSTWHLEFPGVEQVPGLVLHGTKDQFFRGQDKTVMELRTKRNAPITMVMEYGMAHWPKNTDETFRFLAEYCQACIDGRLQDGPKLATLAETLKSAWLGQVYDLEKSGYQKRAIAPATEYKGEKETANYLPNAAFAKIWARYCETGK